MKFFVALLVAESIFGCSHDNNVVSPTLNTDPRKAKLITTDIDLFWKVYDSHAPTFNSNVFLNEYFQSGTEALKLFYNQKIKDPSKLSYILNLNPYKTYYESIRLNTQSITSSTESFYTGFEKLKDLYPEAVYPDVVFVIGALGTGGTVVSNQQMVIGAEMFTKSQMSDLTSFNSWLNSVIRSSDYLPSIVIHELVHIQQGQFAKLNGLPYGNGSLLYMALMEGSADFITHLIFDKYPNDHLPAFANPIEEDLWNEFKTNMYGNDLSQWLYNGGASSNRPADLGYYIGFKIAEEYYNNSLDKNAAIKEIIGITDSKKFLDKSGYALKF